MRIIDLTHTITADMPVYPGTRPPSLQEGSSYEADGFLETLLTMFSHTGTHMDAPRHLFAAGRSLDDYPVEQFTGRALCIDCRHKQAGEYITRRDLPEDTALLEQAEFFLFCTGWSRYWGKPAYFGSYPCLDDALLDWLMERKVKGIGLDTIGLDPISQAHLPRHKKLLAGQQTLIIENLKNLDLLGTALFRLTALPLKFKEADGAPVRAIAVLP